MKVFEKVAEALTSLGITNVFGVIGSGNYEVTRSLIERGAHFVAARHEGGAMSMADAFARVGSSVPAVSVHQGCGLTNTITGLTEAAKSGSPIVVLTAEAETASLHSNFRIEQDRLVEAVGARSIRITRVSAVRDIHLAFRIAVTERVPVVVHLPLDVQNADSDEEFVGDVPELPAPPAPSAATVETLAGFIEAAERPVIIAGRGAREAGGELRELAEAAGALLATSAVARGLFARDPFSLDISGGFSTPLAADTIQRADLIISFGSALNMWTMRHGSLIGEGARVVQVDVDPLAPGRHRPADLGIIGDSAETALAITGALQARGVSGERYRTNEMRAAIAAAGTWKQVPYEDLSDGERIDPRTLTIALNGMLDEDRVIAVDSGNFLGYPSAFLDLPDENGLVFSQAFQCVGLGLASAIGASFAQPDRLTICGTGDGGALMGATELESVVRLGIPMVVIVYNDAAYGAELHHFGKTDHDLGFITFPDTDFAAIARGYGFNGVTVRSAADLAPVQEWLAGPRDTPLLIDAKIIRTTSWWLAEAFKAH
ncbi:thiamine pyrophosphate-binding protein [Leucobacter sp. USHLN153]|uniref:thiamine pyrophosphate-binding protein n=1 Tax=Leucobacter sp. USHLN153 TaxID=3081268 RepID=UPI003015EA99